MPLGPSSYSSAIVVANFPRWNPTAAGSLPPRSLTVFLRAFLPQTFTVIVVNHVDILSHVCTLSSRALRLLLMEALASVDSGCFGPTMLRCICMSQQRSQQYQVPSAHGNHLENTPNRFTFPATLFSFSQFFTCPSSSWEHFKKNVYYLHKPFLRVCSLQELKPRYLHQK